MEPIATTFEDQTFTYTQLERQGNIAIYCQQHKEGGAKRYEVVRIRVSKEHTWPNGKTTPEHEAYPGSTRWGVDGFSCFSMDEAHGIMAKLCV